MTNFLKDRQLSDNDKEQNQAELSIPKMEDSTWTIIPQFFQCKVHTNEIPPHRELNPKQK